MPKLGTVGGQLKIRLYRSPGKDADCLADLMELLRAEGIEATVRRANPITHDQWTVILNLVGPVLGVVSKVIEAWNKRSPGRAVDDESIRIELPKVENAARVRVEITVNPASENKPKVKSRKKK